MHTIEDLDGRTTVRAQVLSNQEPSIIITEPSGFTNSGHFYPAASIQLTGLEAIANLHKVLTDLLDEVPTTPYGGTSD